MKRLLTAVALATAAAAGTPAMATVQAVDEIPIGQTVTLNNIDPQHPANTIAGQNVFTLVGGMHYLWVVWH